MSVPLPLWLVVLWLAVSVALAVGCGVLVHRLYKIFDQLMEMRCERDGLATASDIQQKQLARQQELLDRMQRGTWEFVPPQQRKDGGE